MPGSVEATLAGLNSSGQKCIICPPSTIEELMIHSGNKNRGRFQSVTDSFCMPGLGTATIPQLASSIVTLTKQGDPSCKWKSPCTFVVSTKHKRCRQKELSNLMGHPVVTDEDTLSGVTSPNPGSKLSNRVCDPTSTVGLSTGWPWWSATGICWLRFDFSACFCFGSWKLGRNYRAVGQYCGTSKSKSTKCSSWLPWSWSPCISSLFWITNLVHSKIIVLNQVVPSDSSGRIGWLSISTPNGTSLVHSITFFTSSRHRPCRRPCAWRPSWRHWSCCRRCRSPSCAGGNCIKIGLPGKLILSKRKDLREVLFSWK